MVTIVLSLCISGVLELAISMIRTIILFVLIITAMRIMGKRQLGEMEPTELVVTLLISDLATLCMQDPENPLINSVLPIFVLVIVEILISALMLRFPRLRGMVGGRYSVIVDRGKIDQKEMRKAQMTVEELMEAVRQNGLVSLDEVKFCILENDGKISVIPNDDVKQELPLILVADGVPVKQNMLRSGVTLQRLEKLAKKQGIDRIRDVFLLYRTDGNYVCIGKEGKK